MAKSTYYRPAVDDTTPVHDQLFVSTWDKLGQKNIEDMISIDRPFLTMLLEMKDSNLLSGCEQARINVITSFNPNGGWVDESEGLSLDDYDPFETLYYWPKHLARSVKWTKEQMRINRSSPQQIFSIIDEKIKNTIETLRRDLSVGGWTSGGGKLMDGLAKMVPATLPASQSTSIGGKTPSSYAWHQTHATNMSGYAAVTDLEDFMLTMWNDIYVQLGKTHYICCDQTTHETYEKNAREYLFTGPSKIGDMNFELVQYKKAPLIFDEEAPDNEMRFIDKNEIKFLVVPEYYMKWTDWKEPLNVPFQKHRQIVVDANMGRRQARRLGCIYNITASGS